MNLFYNKSVFWGKSTFLKLYREGMFGENA